MSDNTDFVATGLVRSFSDALKQENCQPVDKTSSRQALEDALVERIDFEDSFAILLRGATSSPRTSSQVNKHYEELRKAVGKFQNTFGDTLKTDGEGKPLSWTSISDGISRIKSQHIEKAGKGFRGKTKDRFHRVCEGINNHCGVLKILPQEYAGPVCASIEMIVKASVNHEQMGEDFASALEEIDEIVHTTHQGLALFPEDPRLQDLVAQLCCRILDFVAIPLRWYGDGGGKRLRASLNENASKAYEKQVNAIRTLARFIDQAVSLCTSAEVVKQSAMLARQHRELQEERLRSKWQTDESHYALFQQAANESNRQLREDMHGRLLQMSMCITEPASNDLGQPIKQILDREAVEFVANERDDHFALMQQVRVRDTDVTIKSIAESRTGTKTLLRTRGEVEGASDSLNAFFDFDKILPRAPGRAYYAETDVVQRLQEWTAGPWSSFLGIFGPFAISSENAFQLLTSNYVHAAKGANIACVSYFCELPHGEPGPRRLPETVETAAMLCALIRQMVLHLPTQLPEHPQLEAQRFEGLDGTLKTWEAGLCLLSDMIALTEAPVLLFAIYGLEMLEHDATRKRLTAFVETLRQHMSASGAEDGQRSVMKVLFVTSGVSEVLASKLDNEEICDMNRGGAALRPGAARRGRSALSDLDFGA